MMRKFLKTPARRAISGLAVMLVAAVGCDCEGGGLRGAEPKLVVDPESFTLEGVPGRFTEHTLKVSNEGSSLLRVESVEIVDEDGDEFAEFAIVQKFVEDCDGEIRPETGRMDILTSTCAIVRFRYLPHDDGFDQGAIIIRSNDPDNPTLRIPINGSAETPKLQVCAFEGSTELGCNKPGTIFEVDFGISPPGSPVARTLKLKSQGSRAVDIEGLTLRGDPDFSVTPDDYSASLSPGEGDSLEVVFDATIGGPRDARLVIRSNDPVDERLEIRLRATGDGSKLCLCVTNAAGACRPATVADFGRTAIGGTSTRILRLSSCGTKDLELKSLELASGAPLFAAAFPGLPRTMAPNAPHVDVEMTFSPVDMGRAEGRINIETAEESGFVTLAGEGYESGCKLVSAATTLDFGSVGINMTGERKYTIANRGDETCVVKAPNAAAPTEGPHISQGADVSFKLTGFPTVFEVPPAQTIAFTLGYEPKDLNGPDVGEFSVPYSGEEPGSPLETLKVQLKGTPVAEPVCVLKATPDANGLFGRTLNFGQVRIHTEKVMPVTFTNIGSANCLLSTVKVVGGGMGGIPLPGLPDDTKYFSVKNTPRTPLPPGQSTTVDVAFKPDGDRFFGGEDVPVPGMPVPGSVKLQVKTSDTVTFNGCGAMGGFPGGSGGGVPGCVEWGLFGEGAKSDLAALPSDYDFGLVTLGCNSREETITLYNVGTLPANIQSVRLDPANAPFSVILPPVPFALNGGASMQFKVKYRPSDESIHTATLYIESDATNGAGPNAYISVGLKGTGTTETHVRDVFDQGTRPKTDVLFVIDDSGSMGEEQAYLANNARSFLNVATSLNTDFQVGVVTTDTSVRAGQFRGTPRMITPTSGADPAAQFAKTVKDLGTNGDATERGLQAMVEALTPPNITDANINGGFLRQDAKLAVVVISDEDDFSSGTLDFYTDFLKNIKGIHNQALVTLSAIVGDEPKGCSGSGGSADAGSRYLEVQRRTNGKFRSICSTDWGQIAAELGLDAFGARAGFPLSRVAVESTIQVTVDGQPSRKPDWRYDAPPNTVVFAPTALPDPNEKIVIEYDAYCF